VGKKKKKPCVEVIPSQSSSYYLDITLLSREVLLCWISVKCLVPCGQCPGNRAARRGAEPPGAGNMILGFLCPSGGLLAELPTKSSFAETDAKREKK